MISDNAKPFALLALGMISWALVTDKQQPQAAIAEVPAEQSPLNLDSVENRVCILESTVESLQNRLSQLEQKQPQPTPATPQKAEQASNSVAPYVGEKWNGKLTIYTSEPTDRSCVWCEYVKQDQVFEAWSEAGLDVEEVVAFKGQMRPTFSVCFGEACYVHNGYFPGATTEERRARFDAWIQECYRLSKLPRAFQPKSTLRDVIQDKMIQRKRAAGCG